MDGVLAIYDKNAYIGQKPIWLQPEKHYFSYVEPDERMCNVAMQLINIVTDPKFKPGAHITSCHFLTSTARHARVALIQYRDKCEWLDRNVGMHTSSLLIPSISRDKHRTIKARLTHSLTPKDVLVDDFNENLIAWNEAGGTAIKYLNGINSDSDSSMPVIDPDMTADDIIEFLLMFDKSLLAQYKEKE